MVSEQSKAVQDILQERQRQVQSEGFSESHDDGHRLWQLPRAAFCYVDHYISRSFIWNDGHESMYREEAYGSPSSDAWPWSDSTWKPKSPRRDLVRAAALLIAEIERLDRQMEVSANDRT